MAPSKRMFSKPVIGWALYDWANSVFATTVMAGFIQAFYANYWRPGVESTQSTAELNMTNVIASVSIAVLAPVLGAIADRGGAKKRLLGFFAGLGVLATALLALPGEGMWLAALVIYGVGALAFTGANIFYDSLIVDVAPRDRLDSVSSLGFGLGYLGGGLLFLLHVFMVNSPETFGLDGRSAAVRVAFVTAAIWWGVFSIFLFLWVPEERPEEKPKWAALAKEGVRDVLGTLREIKQYKAIALFLVAYIFYIDGVNSIIKSAVKFGSDVGFETADLMKALLLVQFVAFPAALAFGEIGRRIGPKRALFIAIGGYVLITLLGSQMQTTAHFYMLAVAIALFQGGVQALSRSWFAALIPDERSGKFFGFYNMVGKFTAIIGLTLMAVVGLISDSVRAGMASLVLLFVIGGIILWFVPGAREVRKDPSLVEEGSTF